VRIVDYTSIASKDLRRQFVRSSLTIFALTISTVILVIMAAISLGGRQAIIDQFGTDASLTTISVTPNQSSGTLGLFGDVQEVNTSASKLDDATIAKLTAIPHVASAYPSTHIWEINSFSLTGNNKQLVAQANGIPNNAILPLKVGTRFSSNNDKNVVLLGYAYAKALGYGDTPAELIGKTVQFTTQKGYRGVGAIIPGAQASEQETASFNESGTTLSAKIVGVTDTGPDQNSLFIPLGWAHAIRTAQYNQGDGTVKTVDQLVSDGYTTIRVNADSTTSVKSISGAISHLGYGQTSTLSQVERLQQFSTTMWVILGAVALTATVAAALGVVNTMLMSVSEQRYVIGVWRACGARRGFIVKLFLVEAGLLGLIGGASGAGIGLFVSQFVNEYVNTLLASQGFTLTNIAIVPLWLVAGTIAMTTLFGILAGLYPAYRAARQDPSQALNSGQ
jgi:putative ABC transport system permease protein